MFSSSFLFFLTTFIFLSFFLFIFPHPIISFMFLYMYLSNQFFLFDYFVELLILWCPSDWAAVGLFSKILVHYQSQSGKNLLQLYYQNNNSLAQRSSFLGSKSHLKSNWILSFELQCQFSPQFQWKEAFHQFRLGLVGKSYDIPFLLFNVNLWKAVSIQSMNCWGIPSYHPLAEKFQSFSMISLLNRFLSFLMVLALALCYRVSTMSRLPTFRNYQPYSCTCFFQNHSGKLLGFFQLKILKLECSVYIQISLRNQHTRCLWKSLQQNFCAYPNDSWLVIYGVSQIAAAEVQV